MMRVLAVDYSVGFGGATKSAAQILRELPSVEAFVLTSQDREIRERWYDGATVIGFRRLVNYRTRWRVIRWVRERGPLARLAPLVRRALSAFDRLYTAASAIRIAWLLLRFRIDVMHLQNGFTPQECLLAGWITGVPRIVHLRGFVSHDGDPPARWRLASFVVGDSDAVLESVPAELRPDGRAATIYETVDVAAFDRTVEEGREVRRRYGLDDDEVAVGIFGRVLPWKGQREFVSAVLRALGDEPRLRAFIVGDYSDAGADYAREIRSMIDATPRPERFVLTGYTPAVEPYYHAMDIVVHASIRPEPCGMVILEAMAARKPVIASAAGGPTELVDHGVDGLLVDPGDRVGMSRAIRDLAADPRRREAMGERGHRKARDRFDTRHVARQVHDLYRRLVCGDPAGPEPGGSVPPADPATTAPGA